MRDGRPSAGIKKIAGQDYPGSIETGLRPMRIMLVDDEEDITATLKIILERESYSVDAFNDSRLALSRFQRGRYDLVITDIRMPTMNGFNLYRGLKEIEPEVRVCFFTAFDIYASEFKKTFPETAIVGLIRKPIAGQALIRQIKAMVSDDDVFSDGDRS
jgi:two-component system, OmpR family, response regulator ChvI